MQQFYENLQAASRREVIKLFGSAKDIAGGEDDRSNFVPFNQERDKLGRLISRQAHERNGKLKRNSLPARIQDRRFANPESKVSEKVRQSNITVEKIFKLHDIKGSKKQGSLSKLRILSTASRENMVTPTVGHYDTAIIADRFKYNKTKFTAMGVPQTHPPMKKQLSDQLLKPRSRSTQLRQYGEQCSTQKDKQYKKVEINYDLPELQMYHEMRKLKMKLYDNFEQSHLRFKQLARYSLVLANRIKKGLELD